MASESFDMTVPLDESFTEIDTIHGRDYQRYSLQNNVYFSPVDEVEVQRLKDAHKAFSKVFDYRLIFPPVNRPRKVLDCGSGTGAWAAEVAAEYPACKVLGIDVSPHMWQYDYTPNLDFQVDDLNRRFTFDTGEFDLVHSQMVAGGINAGRWKSYLKDMHRVIRPGGWCQIVEIYFNAQSDNGSLTPNSGLSQWSELYLRGASEVKDPRVPLRMKELVRHAGFVDVETNCIPLPMCGWSTDPRMNEIGQLNRDNVQRLLSSQAMYIFTEKLGMPFDQAQVLIAQARLEARTPAIKAYFPLYVCIGRKRP